MSLAGCAQSYSASVLYTRCPGFMFVYSFKSSRQNIDSSGLSPDFGTCKRSENAAIPSQTFT